MGALHAAADPCKIRLRISRHAWYLLAGDLDFTGLVSRNDLTGGGAVLASRGGLIIGAVDFTSGMFLLAGATGLASTKGFTGGLLKPFSLFSLTSRRKKLTTLIKVI